MKIGQDFLDLRVRNGSPGSRTDDVTGRGGGADLPTEGGTPAGRPHSVHHSGQPHSRFVGRGILRNQVLGGKKEICPYIIKYWVTQKLPQICAVILCILIGKVA